MSLSEKLRAKKCRVETVEIDGDAYRVTGVSMRQLGEVVSGEFRLRKTIPAVVFDAILLAECVTDVSDESKASIDEWLEASSHITTPLVPVAKRVCGIDLEGRSDPKDSGAIET